MKDPMKSIPFLPKIVPGWGGVGCVMQGWGGMCHVGMGCVMQGWGGVCCEEVGWAVKYFTE